MNPANTREKFMKPHLRGPNRRELLVGTAATAGLLSAPARASSASERRFLFLTCFGGWDPTRVLVPAFSDTGVDMEPGSSPLTVGDLQFVDHPNRPRTRQTLRDWGERFALVNGMLVPSVAHMACLQLNRTGQLSGHPDWAAILASQSSGAEALPHLVISGPSYPGELGASVARTGAGGQLSALIDGSIIEWTGEAPPAPTGSLAAREDTLVAARRTAALARASSERERALLEAHAEAESRLGRLYGLAEGLSWGASGTFLGEALQAIDLLAAGVCRCASVGHPTLWDSHSENDIYQNVLWEETMDALGQILTEMATRTGPAGGSLLDETVVVLTSEMGRSPRLNANRGKDHWPYATTLLVGAGVQGGTTAGAYDPGLLGATVNPTSGAPDPAGGVLTTQDLGATLLALGDVDPAEWTPYGAILQSLLA
jgi:uncharacterized protein (DUF1501 family)